MSHEIWKPIEDLPPDWEDLHDASLSALASVWREQKARLENSQAYQIFIERLRRRFAIETGIIERLYSIDRGTTRLLIERGIDEALIEHGSTDKPAVEVVALIRDNESAIDQVFNFVGSQRQLSTSFIKQLHQLLTWHQDYTEAVDQFGKLGRIPLLKGEWKRHPNNPKRNGTIYLYCPPEQVASQMDQLIAWHLQHVDADVSPEIEAAWLHHRFTQIHPFQDGNGRVARLLASLVLIRAGWFPLVITRDERREYIEALEQADKGDLRLLVELFAATQRHAFIRSLSISEDVIAEKANFDMVLNAVVDKLSKRQAGEIAEIFSAVESRADTLFQLTLGVVREKAADIQENLATVVSSADVYVRSANSEEPNANYFQYQIVEVARTFDYFANLRGYKSWVSLVIRLDDDLKTELLFSFHHLGRDPKGIMVCSALGYRRRTAAEEDTASHVQDIEPLASAPFEFTYLEDTTRLQERFRKWLEQALVVGLEYWRRGLGL